MLLVKFQQKQVHGSLSWRQQALWTEGWISLCVECRTFLAAYNIARWWAVLLGLNCLHFLHPVCGNRGCSGALWAAKDQACHLSGIFRKGKKKSPLRVSESSSLMIYLYLSIVFCWKGHLIYFKRSRVFSEPSLHISCDIYSIPSKGNFLAWQATEQCSFFLCPFFSQGMYVFQRRQHFSLCVCLVMCII